MRTLAPWCLLLASCAGPPAAPDDLDGLTRYFYRHFSPAPDADPAREDEELQDAIAKLHEAIGADDLGEPDRGTLAAITKAELDSVGMGDVDPSVPQGMFVTNLLRCDLDRLEAIILAPDQLSLYPEAYQAYSSTFDEDVPPFMTTWVHTYTTAENALFSNQFTATVHNGVRRVPALPDSAHGRALVRRGYIPAPATFEQEGSEFTFDFQVETFHERAKGEVVHLYAMWRYMRFGALGDSYDDVFIDQTTSGMIGWDDRTAALCAR